MQLRLRIVAAVIAALGVAASARADLLLPRVSPNATVKQTVGITDLTLTYSRPGVKNRVIWGGLVPFGKTWRTGANEATTFTTTDEITVAGHPLAAGTYSFFTVPGPGEWTVIFNRQKNQFGAFSYDSTQDVLRVSATPDTTQPHEEWMWLGFDDLTPTSCALVLRWEKLRVAVPIAVGVDSLVLAGCRREVAAARPDDWRTPMRAAGWCLDSGVAAGEGRAWLDRSLGVQENYNNVSLQARWLMKDGKKKEAIAAAKKAIELGKASKEKVDTSGTERLLTDWTAKK
jgi:hypothetical protein